MRFPEKEAEVSQLAGKVIFGLEHAPEDFPHPPVPPAELRQIRDAYTAKMLEVKGAEAALAILYREKDKLFREMEAATSAELRYAEIVTRRDPVKLSILGWGPPRQRRRLEVPGEVRDMAVGHQGETTVDLSWNPPVDGGAVATYIIERKAGAGSAWETIETTGETEIRLDKQPRGVEIQYRVRGLNKAGEGRESATVMVVL